MKIKPFELERYFAKYEFSHQIPVKQFRLRIAVVK